MIKKSMEIKEYLYFKVSDEEIEKHKQKMFNKGYEIRDKFLTRDGENLVIEYIRFNESVQRKIG